MKTKIKIAIALIISLIVIGCAHNEEIKAMKPDTQEKFYGTYLFINPCRAELITTATPRSFGLEIAAALASGVVKTGIDWIGASLQRAAEDDVEKTTVSSNLTSISRISNSQKNICLQVVRGEFRYSEGNNDVYNNEFAISENSRKLANLKVVNESEELFIEVLPIIHNKVVSFTPLEVRYSGYTPSDRRTKKPRDLALFVGYSAADKDISAGEFTGRLINFGTITPDGEKQATIKYVTADGRLSLVNQTQWLSLPETTDDQPLTFAATIVETRKASQFSKFLAAAFESSKEDIKNKTDAAIAELEIFKTSRELKNEKLKDEKEKLDNEKAYLDALAAVIKNEEALKALCNSQPAPSESQIYDAEKELYFLKKSANIAADSAGKSRPYPDSKIQTPDKKCDEQ